MLSFDIRNKLEQIWVKIGSETNSTIHLLGMTIAYNLKI